MVQITKSCSVLLLASMAYATTSSEDIWGVYTVTDKTHASKFLSRQSTFEAAITKDPKFSSVANVLVTAIPETYNVNQLFNPSYGSKLTTEPWYTALPSDVKDYFLSLATDERKLMTQDAPGAKPTGKKSGAAAIGGSQPGGSLRTVQFSLAAVMGSIALVAML